MAAQPNYFTCTLGQAKAHNLTDDDFVSISHFLDHQAENAGALPAVGFAIPPSKTAPDRPWGRTVYTFKDLHRASLAAATLFLKRHPEQLSRSETGTVALICPSTPEFLFAWLGLMRLGLSVLLIAPQCQPSAIAHLCRTTGANVVYYDKVYESQAQEAAALKTEARPEEHSDRVHELEALSLPFASEFEILQLMKLSTGRNLDKPDVSPHDTAYLHHTSGTSSGLPKAIPQSHRAGCGVLPRFSNGRDTATFTTTPLYHGGIADCFRAWTSNAMIWLFPGKGVPITPSNIVKCLDVAAECRRRDGLPPVRYFSSVPYVLQGMEADANGLRYLQMMHIVGVGGAALPAEVGDRLVEKDVNLISRYGSAECGFLLSSRRDYATDKEWQYLRSDDSVKDLLKFERREDDGLSELVVLNGWPHMAKQNRDDGSFASADLLAPHTTIPNAWKYHSRADSQLTLLTGKKFDPAPLEGAIATSDLLDDALIFGNGQPFPGCLLFRSKHASQLSDAELLEKVWPAVEKLNNESQDHARIPRKMLIPVPVLDSPLEKSSKGTVIRGAAERRFNEHIEKAYVDYGGISTDSSEAVPDDQVEARIIDMIRSVTSNKADASLDANTDLYAYGVDSVAGMQLRFGLRQLLSRSVGGDSNDKQSSSPVTKQLPLNIVEDCGTVGRLADYIVKARHGQKDDGHAANDDDEHKLMLELVEKYSKFVTREDIAPSKGSVNGDDEGGRDVVVLTGATGALGAHLLDQYTRDASVSKIYCLVRGADRHASSERVSKALEQRGLQPLSEMKVVILQASLGDARLGLSAEVYDRLASEATIILHVAWSVNFRMRLRSFEKENISSVTNLINLALSSKRPHCPRFGFCSSVASVLGRNVSSGPVAEHIFNDPSAATSLGYSRSKWVAEHICDEANSKTALGGRIAVFRVGQLAGDSHRGVWNTKEAWPLMLSLVKVTNTLPDLADQALDWLPVDVAATALLQGMQSRDDHARKRTETDGDDDGNNNHESGAAMTDVVHVVNQSDANPKWRQMLMWLQKERKFDTVSPREWVGQLEREESGKAATHPALRLLEHWKTAYGEDSRAHGDRAATTADPEDRASQSLIFDMSRTRQQIPALRAVAAVDEEYFLKIWRWIDRNM